MALLSPRRHCRMMGGDVTVASEPGNGSSITVHLPFTAADIEANEDEHAADGVLVIE